ncbi:LPXTG cell wall anchor domain-containing protein [Paenibacillus algorifonticola]|uniref:LPXTG cell wall anchor domain-containing protein n=1 Tax=Paenibacillus algorifonticola TaxID=684063 RepID=UPI0006196512|nr:LPXTG cell wall anchor domain-containing protein [Paenibacillus algorifonticola]
MNPGPGPANPDPDQADNPGSGVDNGTGDSTNGAGNVDNELDDVPETGDNSVPPAFYMALALMSLITIGLCLLGGKKKKHIQ